MKGLFDPEEATRQLEKAIVPAADSYEYPTGPFTRHEATLRIQEIRDAIAAYARTDDTLEADAALLAIMRAVGTQKSPRALYGGPGGSTDRTNPGNPKGQVLSRASDRLRQYARKEHKRLKTLLD